MSKYGGLYIIGNNNCQSVRFYLTASDKTLKKYKILY